MMLNTTKKSRPRPLPFVYDGWLLLTTFMLITVGVVMVASASMVISDHQFGMPFHFLSHQILYVTFGALIGYVVLKMPIAFWERFGVHILLISIILLVVVFIPGVGRQVNGSTRWLGFGGFGIEVSEVAKIAFIVYLAGYLVRREDEIRTRARGFLKPVLLLLVFAVALLLEPDFGSLAVITVTTLGMLFLSGARMRYFSILAVLAIAALALIAIASPYRVARLTSFLNPWATPYASGYQLTQSLIAFGRGGVFGVGLGNSMQKLFYLPEAHTDFLFAVLAEEFGILGELVVFALFAVFVWRAFAIGRLMQQQNSNFSAYLAYGIALCFSLQAMINIGVNAGVLPTKGLTLPFISYGGSSMLFNCIMVALLLRIYHEARLSVTKVFKKDAAVVGEKFWK